ncbi:MAG: NnrU family protein [Alphaproteobacteria bacterium]|nr:NnrU family protein [Alphaproteobacteria bacterium]
MALLILAALIWIGLHRGIAGTGLRAVIAARTGENGFRGLFSAISIAAIVFLLWSYRRAETTALWFAPGWLRWLLVFAMLPAFLLFVASVSAPNPTAVAGVGHGPSPVRGMQRVTRHPMLWSFAIWATVHLVGRGDTASIVFFGAFLVTALAGMPSIDAKLARRDPASWAALARDTSILPFGAIVADRNRFAPGEIGWVVWVGGIVGWIALLALHKLLFGVAPIPR